MADEFAEEGLIGQTVEEVGGFEISDGMLQSRGETAGRNDAERHAMYFCLKEQSLLRGWEKLPTAIVDGRSGDTLFIEPGMYSKMRDMPWMLFEGSPFLDEAQEEFLDQMVEAGILEKRDEVQKLTGQQAYRLYPNRYLKAAHWAMTGRCNCRCRHCYMSAPNGQAGDYSHKECMDIVDQMERAGIMQVSLTGGEALVRGGFLEIAERLTEAGIRIRTIMSNGLLVNEGLLDALDNLGQKPEFNMSFDGIGCHDWLRGVAGAEEKVVRAFELCAERGFPTGAEYCLHRNNEAAFRDSVKLLGELGCRSLKVNGLSAEGEALNIRDEIIPLQEEYRFYLDYLPHYYEDGEPVPLTLSGMFRSAGRRKAFIPFAKMREDRDCGNHCLCGHARNYMYISQDGYIAPCIPIGSSERARSQFPNVRSTTLADALQDSFYMSFIDTRLDEYLEGHPECAACEYRNRCAGGCRGQAAGGGDLMARDEETCSFFKGGWLEKTKALLEGLRVEVPDV